MYLPEACLFDLDGLLLDTEPLHGQVWSKVAANFGGNLSKTQLRLLRGMRRIDCAAKISEWLGNSIGSQELLKFHKPISENLISQAEAMPGAQELIVWCFKKKIPMALVSSSTSESLALKSAPHSWLDLIETKVLGDDSLLSKGKPAPDPYLLAAQKLGVKARYCWAFEDSQSGTKAAIDAGCQVWVLKDKEDNSLEKKTKAEENPCYINHLNVALEELKKAYLNNKKFN